CICFGRKILRGCRSVKVSSNLLAPFDSPNFPLMGEVGIHITIHDFALQDASREKDKDLKIRKIKKQIILSVKIFPGIESSALECMLNMEGLRAIIIEAYGIGNIHNKSKGLKEILKKATEKGILIIVTTQCLQGYVDIGLYEAGQLLVEAGAISAYDMTFEAIITKLYYLFSISEDMDEIKRFMQKNMRGEITI
ncbi:MAG: asparaginase domain-containing protein, partial [Peptostreptococcales bacterium]